MNSFSPVEPIERLVVIGRSHVDIAEQEGLVDTFGVGRDYLLEKSLSVVGAACEAVGLCKAGYSVEGRRAEAKTSIVCVDGLLILAVESRGISEKKPELRIIWGGLRSPLCEIERNPVLPLLESKLRAAGEPGILNVRSPPQFLV